jgi:carboxypeptidase C (cathepsin A)
MRVLNILSSLSAASLAAASFPPSPENVITKQIKNVPGASISYKETHICETKAKAYAGYVDMPGECLADVGGYNISTFFWYFRARNNPEKAPTTIYLAGGPGESSLYGATSDGGPCYVLKDANSTESNPWSWNENSNMLYVDQPVTAGFSYSEAINSTWNFLWDGSDGTQTPIVPLEAYNGSVPAENSTLLYGTYPDQNPALTANNSVIAARALWHFAQLWFPEFPEQLKDNVQINIAGNSYGGYWVSTSTAYFERQNVKIKAGEIKGTCLNLGTAVITNGEVDFLLQTESYPTQAHNNTYSFKAISDEQFIEAQNNYTKPGGCRDLIQECRAQGALYDPDEVNLNKTVAALCTSATDYCYQYVLGAYATSGRSAFDMASKLPNPYPPSYSTGWANKAWVQQALGARINFTENSYVSQAIMFADIARRDGLKDLEYLLSRGIGVALIYGDRDYRCPWIGAEQLSNAANWSGADAYRKAGYEEIHVNSSYVGGVAKQHGLLSFARVFQAGHDVAWYQPETSFQIFDRAISGRDIPTGRKRIGRGRHAAKWSTKGPLSAYGWREELPESPPVECELYDVATTCTENQVSITGDRLAKDCVGVNCELTSYNRLLLLRMGRLRLRILLSSSLLLRARREGPGDRKRSNGDRDDVGSAPRVCWTSQNREPISVLKWRLCYAMFSEGFCDILEHKAFYGYGCSEVQNLLLFYS